MITSARISLLLASTVLILSSAFAQASADSLFARAQGAYDSGDFDTAELFARRSLDQADTLDSLGKVKYHFLLGAIQVARNQNDAAFSWFTKVVAANPDYYLDPVQISPKIRDVFEAARAAYLLRMRTEPEIFRMPQSDVRLAASWRSLLVPGWGQFYKEQDNKATAIIAAQVLSLAALLFTQTEVNRRHNDYLRIKAHNDPNTEDRYAEYRRAYQVRNVVGYVTLGIYLANYLDALYYPVPRSSRK